MCEGIGLHILKWSYRSDIIRVEESIQIHVLTDDVTVFQLIFSVSEAAVLQVIYEVLRETISTLGQLLKSLGL